MIHKEEKGAKNVIPRLHLAVGTSFKPNAIDDWREIFRAIVSLAIVHGPIVVIMVGTSKIGFGVAVAPMSMRRSVKLLLAFNDMIIAFTTMTTWRRTLTLLLVVMIFII